MITSSRVGAAYSFKKTAAGTFPAVDVIKAKALLADAGYPTGFDMNMIYSPARPGPEADQIAVLLQTQLKKIGINLTLTRIASASLVNSSMMLSVRNAGPSWVRSWTKS